MPRALKGGGAGKTAVQRLGAPKPTGGLKRTKLNPSWLKECGVVGQSILAQRVCLAKQTPKRVQSKRPRLSKAVAQFNHGKPPVVPLAIQRMITPNRYAGIPFLSSSEMMQRHRQLQLAGPAPVAVAPRGSRPSIPMPAPILLPSAEAQQLRSELGKRKLDEIAARRLASVTPAAPPKKKRRIITNNNNYYNTTPAGVPDAPAPGIAIGDDDDGTVYVVPPYPANLPPSLPFPSEPPIPVPVPSTPGYLSQAASAVGTLASNVGSHVYNNAGKYLAALALYKAYGYLNPDEEPPQLGDNLFAARNEQLGEDFVIDMDNMDNLEHLPQLDYDGNLVTPIPASSYGPINPANISWDDDDLPFPPAAASGWQWPWAQNSEDIEMTNMAPPPLPPRPPPTVPQTESIFEWNESPMTPSTPIPRTPMTASSVTPGPGTPVPYVYPGTPVNPTTPMTPIPRGRDGSRGLFTQRLPDDPVFEWVYTPSPSTPASSSTQMLWDPVPDAPTTEPIDEARIAALNPWLALGRSGLQSTPVEEIATLNPGPRSGWQSTPVREIKPKAKALSKRERAKAQSERLTGQPFPGGIRQKSSPVKGPKATRQNPGAPPMSRY
jgi:hypothetical protein